MRSILLIVSLFGAFSLAANTQKAEPIYSFATISKPSEYYKSQAKLWQLEIDKNAADAYAWFNYYRASRNLLRTDTSDHRSWEEKGKAEIAIIDQMEKAVPNSFEYNLSRWMTAGNNYTQLGYLKKAYELGKNRPEICAEMINWGEIERNMERRNEFADKWFKSDLASPGILSYNYNVMAGLKDKAIIFTCGDNDTYPLWMLQAEGYRKDITVLNLSLLSINEYRDKVFKELKISGIDSSSMQQAMMKEDNGGFKLLITHVSKELHNRPVYIALTVDAAYTKEVEENLYLTGMAYEYHQEPLDNMALLKRNFEQVYALDYIDKVFYKDISADIAKRMNLNYIVPMIKLYDHYTDSGELQKQAWMKEKILAVAAGSEEKKAIKEYLDNK
jgi:hypothetical protein